MEDYPNSVTKQCHETILKQMNNSFVVIKEKEIGIFIHIKNENKDIYAILINNYINNEDYKDTIKIKINNQDENIELEDIIYKNKEDNISIIKLKQKNKKINYIEIDDKLYEDKIYNKESIYIIQYNNINDILISYGIIKEINNNKLKYIGNINSKYELCVIFNLSNNKLIGIHLNNHDKYFKNEIDLKKNIHEFLIKKKHYKYMNEINILIKIEKEDINKDIYFLDKEYTDNYLVKDYIHDNLEELNEYNTEVFINKNEYKYKKYFKPEKEGEYNISIRFTIDLKDCTAMFAGCKNIININFISFNTKNVTNMSWMFADCCSLNNLEGIYKCDTKNVTNMSGMFYGCSSLNNLEGISKWDTKNVTNMNYMFYGCSSLNNLEGISKWDTKNVKNMIGMFYGCSSLNNLERISKWDTKNVTNMREMFRDCSSLNNLEGISKWDTKNVTNMSGMFYGCSSLNNLEGISKWDTKNVTNMTEMFYGCSSLNNLEGISKWDTKNVWTMSRMFSGCGTNKIPENFSNK